MTDPRDARVRAIIATWPHYAADRDGTTYGPVDPGYDTFVRHEDLADLVATLLAEAPQETRDAAMMAILCPP
jgi:hypothetical protein